ncbi:MAG TPA: hypothetical protein PKA13_20895 [Geminicoccaceae bacterium]|nr:hypothetical protein [Geminicoccus sp.]HMU52249.1 hypothetical protein [Geminicoccaceae bacterium]
MRRIGLFLVFLASFAPFPVLSAGPPRLADYFGSYVGRAVERPQEGGAAEERDIDIVISPYKNDGFRIDWTNVTLVDGRRDVPGVKRRPSSVIFVPGDGKGLFVESREFDPFKLKDDVQAMQGEPVRWAGLDEDGLHVNAFVLLEDGRYEMQIYTRRLTEVGLDLTFERVVDGEPVRRMTGRAVRAD